MLQVKKSVLPEELLLSETEKKLLEEEGKKYGEPLKEIEKDIKYDMCFACGEENPIGLHLHFFGIPDGVAITCSGKKACPHIRPASICASVRRLRLVIPSVAKGTK